MSYKKYFLFNDIGEPGAMNLKFISNLNDIIILSSNLHPCLQIIEGNEFKFVPGYLSNDNAFYPSPIQVCYLLIEDIAENAINIGGLVKFKLEFSYCLFTKSKISFINDKFTIIQPVSICDSFLSLERIINLLNYIVNRNEFINESSLHKLSKIDLITSTNLFIISIINGLQIDYFENSENRVGKDNSFWVEAEVSKLPLNKYLRDLIFTSLKKLTKQIYKTDYGYLIEFESEKSYSPSTPRLKIKVSGNDSFKSNLKLDLMKEFNYYEYLYRILHDNETSLDIQSC